MSVVSSAVTTMDSLVRNVAKIASVPVPMAVGTVLDQTYELVERVGGGGMGVVYRARDQKLGREVAIKLLKLNDGNESLHDRQMFEREARATALLQHPNIVTLHNVGEYQAQPYLVLELLQGETVAARIARRRKLPPEQALAIVDAVLTALVFAHARGVLHRDLKPNNVFITIDDRVKVLDFGLALSLDADPGPRTRSAGTPGYMAPEQQRGNRQDARTDGWAAALFLVECLSGKASSEPQVIEGLAVSRAVRKALGRALDPNPLMRPQTAAELRSDLAKGYTQKVLALTPAIISSLVTRRRWAQIFSYLVGAALLAVVGAVAMKWWVPRKAPTSLASPSVDEINAASWVTGANGWQQLHIEPNGKAYGVYSHDQGVFEGTFKDGVLTGWWCEAPTRTAPTDAGRIELRFLRGATHSFIEGRWSYGPQGPWVNDLNGYSIELIGDPAPQKQRERLATHPRCSNL